MKHFIFSILVFVGSSSFAQKTKDHPHCKELDRFGCAPGSYNDGTGTTKSETELKKSAEKIVQKHHSQLQAKVLDALNKEPEGEGDKDRQQSFRKTALSALGLWDAPQCTSDEPEQKTKCNNDLSEGVTSLMEKSVFGHHGVVLPSERVPNFQDLMHLVQNQTYDSLVNSLRGDLASDFDMGEQRERIDSKIFPKVKKTLLKKIDSMPVDEDTKTLLKSKISSITFNKEDCKTGKKKNLIALMDPNAHYQPFSQSVSICDATLFRTNSEFAIVGHLAHELGHAIDPCNITRSTKEFSFKYKNMSTVVAAEAEFPIANVLRCLRSEKSIAAIRNPIIDQFDTQKYNENVAAGKTGVYEDGAKKDNTENPFCKKRAPYTQKVIDQDQVGEAFSDWIAAEVLPDYMEDKGLTTEQYRIGYSNTFRHACNASGDGPNPIPVIESDDDHGNSSDFSAFDPHPPVSKRYNAIILTQPKIRAQMGCKEQPDALYCSAEAHYEAIPEKDAHEKPTTDLDGKIDRIPTLPPKNKNNFKMNEEAPKVEQ